jgi:hypothetical protein
MRGATPQGREFIRIGHLSSHAMDQHAPTFMIRRPALVSLKRQASAEVQPVQRSPLGRTEDDVTVEHCEIDWHDDRETVGHVADAADNRLR